MAAGMRGISCKTRYPVRAFARSLYIEAKENSDEEWKQDLNEEQN